jgi:hypothetical protein
MIPAVNVSQIAGGQKVGGALTSWQVPNGPDIVEHLGGVSPDGDVLVFFWSPAHDWQAVNVSQIAGGQKVGGALTSWQVPNGPDIVEHLGGVSPDGDVLVFFWRLGDVYVVSLLGVLVSDDAGLRTARTTPQQFQQWIAEANSIFAGANIWLNFDPLRDWVSLNRTSINNLSSSAGQWTEANQYAAQFSNHLVVFFRFGPDANPTGNGFSFPPSSGRITNFVAMPGFDDTSVIVGKDSGGNWIRKQNIDLFAHELGHYFGLFHTFHDWADNVTDTPQKASEYIRAHGSTADALDGDGLSDTPPDAGTNFYINQGWDPCSGHDRYVIEGIEFQPDRQNVMSYFACRPMHFSAMQGEVMRRITMMRGQLGLSVGRP